MSIKGLTHIDGQVLASVKRWRAPSWIEKVPQWLRNNNRFLVAIRRFGSYEDQEVLSTPDVVDLLTNGGRDWMHAQVYTNTAAGSVAGIYMALTSNAAAANVTDTVLAAEITRTDLDRQIAGTLTHASDSSTCSLISSWTASASYGEIVKAATFNSTSAGTMVHEGTVTTATLQANDVYQLTFNFSLG